MRCAQCGLLSDLSRRRHRHFPALADAFGVMRRNCETDWARCFPQFAVSDWLGHSILVSAEHYLAVPQELYLKAAGIDQLSATNSEPSTSRLSS